MTVVTKKIIMASLMELLEERSLDKITVRDICELSGINRNTFYYHYSDIYQRSCRNNRRMAPRRIARQRR